MDFENPETKQAVLQHEIESEFESAYLVEGKLIAFGEKAGQKLTDFADYLSLYSDRQTDTLFKQQVKDMIYRLFYKKNNHIHLSLENDIINYQPSLAGVLNYLDASSYESLRFHISDHILYIPLHLDSLAQYTGKLKSDISIIAVKGKDTVLISKYQILTKIKLIQTTKQFGEEKSLTIWQVFLDDIEPIK
ncbi:MAG: hypothetical protein JW830_13445 [Bacteroidales bacterium]|nr:hypothetical protein [Bacteroidales bacterium]